jgi:hypothetical protein
MCPDGGFVKISVASRFESEMTPTAAVVIFRVLRFGFLSVFGMRVSDWANSGLLPDSRVVHTEEASAGEAALMPPDFEKNLAAFGLSAQAFRILGISDRLTVDLHNQVADLQTGFG